MLDPKSKDFNFLIHHWCEMQRMNENINIINEFDNSETRATRNFFRNRVLNNQLEEAKMIVRSLNKNEDQQGLNHFFTKSSISDTNVDSTVKQSKSIAHSLLQEQNIKSTKLLKKLDEINESNHKEDS
ncbi:hypothetical protein M9Y10_002003 [Tritrichomonas musculus]|uniref:Uncharacterized protein n=1 Tax=Tritrichomonas musculus TaxID=1915356 RepID=A0ABR2L8K2_9EUKA